MKKPAKETNWKQSYVRPYWDYRWVLALLISMLCLVGAESDVHAQYIGSSEIKIDQKKLEFDGGLDWEIHDGEMKPLLHGDLDLKDAGGLCGRMRMDFYGGEHVSLTTKYGGEVCAKGDTRQDWEVDLSPYDSNKLNEVKVSIEKKTASTDWTIIGSKTVKLSTIHDKVKITEDGFDFGGNTFVLGAPTNSGDVAWSWTGGKVIPLLTGTLHINNAASACARMRIEYFTLDDVFLADKVGGKVCAADNTHHTWSVDLDPYGDGKLAYIKVSLQTLGADGSWRTIGTHSVTYVNAPFCCENCVCRLASGKLFRTVP